MMNRGINIHTAILEYKQAYEMAGIEPPPYRLTCKEHKELVGTVKKYMVQSTLKDGVLKTESMHPYPGSMIAEYYGVKIEVVMIVEPYL